MEFVKHLNDQRNNYLRFRPRYPEELFDYLATLVSLGAQVWDCGTGTGQAALSLATKFRCILATDISLNQLEGAPKHSKVHFVCCSADKTPFLDQSIDLVTVAQALHWFDFENFYKEVRRVAKPSSLIAAWCYSMGTINETFDPFIRMLYTDILGDEYWPKERHYIDDHYLTLPFPFKKIAVPKFSIEKKFDFLSLIGYLNTWFAVKEYQKRLYKNPIEFIYDDLLAAWGDPNTEFLMSWPVHLLLGNVYK